MVERKDGKEKKEWKKDRVYGDWNDSTCGGAGVCDDSCGKAVSHVDCIAFV